MNSLDFLNVNPDLRRVLLNSKALDIIPGGVDIAIDTTCETIIHNPVSAKFLRTEPWGQFSHSTLEPPIVKVWHTGKVLRPEEMPMQRAAWYGENVVGQELEFVWNDGVRRIARWSASPVRNENGIICGSIATMEDITEIIQLTRELEIRNLELTKERNHAVMQESIIREHSEQDVKFGNNFRNSIDTMEGDLEINTSIRNQNGKIIDFRIDYVNEAAVANTILTKEQLIGHRLLEIMPEQVEFGLFEAYSKVVETGEPLAMEVVVRNESGKYIVGAYDMRAVKIGDGFAVSWHNITEKKKNENALKLSEERFSLIFQFTPIAMAIIRKSDRRHIDVNNRYLSLMGLSREEITGTPPLDMAMDESAIYKVVSQLDEFGSIKDYETNIITRDNVKRAVIISTEQIVIRGEACLLLAITDITEIKQMQAEMARLAQLNLVGQMAAGLGHEIRNPMSVVRGYLQLLGARREFASQRSKFDIMISELDRANSIITEFLSLARNKVSEGRLQNISDILQKLYLLLEADTFSQNKQIVLEVGETTDIFLNEKEISQLVLNLCRNGLEAMQERGTLTIRIYTEDEYVVLSVKDEGCGIPSEYLDKLGTPFLSSKENGTGLGLASCYSIANRHNARIDVQSNSNGTTFNVRFPNQKDISMKDFLTEQ